MKESSEPERSYPVNMKAGDHYSCYNHILAQGVGAVCNEAIKRHGENLREVSIKAPAGLTPMDLRRL
jgi:hypothetical protein